MMERPILAVIPARYGSTRFPGKPLADVFGTPMVVRVMERAQASGVFSEVLVATDDRRIADVVEQHGGRVVMTSETCPNGTARCHEAVLVWEAETGRTVEAVVNVQGDEPYVHLDQLRDLVRLIRKPGAAVATLAKPMAAETPGLHDPNRVKVVCDAKGRALYFSRSPIPSGAGPWNKHIGLYAFTRTALEALMDLHPTPLESRERLEQLRWLECGWRIDVGLTPHETPSVDAPEDLAQLPPPNFES